LRDRVMIVKTGFPPSRESTVREMDSTLASDASTGDPKLDYGTHR
jgi:hypothetical protein